MDSKFQIICDEIKERKQKKLQIIYDEIKERKQEKRRTETRTKKDSKLDL